VAKGNVVRCEAVNFVLFCANQNRHPTFYAEIAQLVERLFYAETVFIGSSPIFCTNFILWGYSLTGKTLDLQSKNSGSFSDSSTSFLFMEDAELGAQQVLKT
jgi:hypothetical protein